MLNFTVGPVMSSEEILEIGAEQVPYFRTPEFSNLMLENERMILELAGAPEGSRAVFLTGSGTAAMEACVLSLLSENDRALVVDGGSFGHRFAELCDIHGIEYETVVLPFGTPLSVSDLSTYKGKGFTAFLVNICETSTGVLYDMEMISDFCKVEGLFLVADAISSFLADPSDMEQFSIGAMTIGSQKALSCPPGVSVVVMTPEAVDRAMNSKPRSMYLDLKNALTNGERGQTPFTCAVSVLRQIHKRLEMIMASGGGKVEIARHKSIATDFRAKIKDLPFEIATNALSNAVTPLRPVSANAMDIFNVLKDEYNIWVCPNGGELADKLFRVGHIGNLTTRDNDVLVNAFVDMQKRGIFKANQD